MLPKTLKIEIFVRLSNFLLIATTKRHGIAILRERQPVTICA